MEIERKWLLKCFPNTLKLLEEVEVSQGYLSTEETEVRIREYTHTDTNHINYLLTVKGSGDIERPEAEEYVSKSFFEEVVEIIGKPLIHKDFRKYRLPDGRVLEVSHVDAGTKHEFYYAEIEFDNIEEAESYQLEIPEIIEDITYNKYYKMKNYWRRTRG